MLTRNFQRRGKSTKTLFTEKKSSIDNETIRCILQIIRHYKIEFLISGKGIKKSAEWPHDIERERTVIKMENLAEYKEDKTRQIKEYDSAEIADIYFKN